MNTHTSHWDDEFRAISSGGAYFGGDFTSPFGLGVIDLTSPKKPYVPSDPDPPTIDHTIGFESPPGATTAIGAGVNPFANFKNPFAATPGATPEEQKQKDKALLVKVALGGAALLALIAITSGSKPIVPVATFPAPRPGNINIRLDRITSFGRKKKK
jgi:hypothetical protein